MSHAHHLDRAQTNAHKGLPQHHAIVASMNTVVTNAWHKQPHRRLLTQTHATDTETEAHEHKNEHIYTQKHAESHTTTTKHTSNYTTTQTHTQSHTVT